MLRQKLTQILPQTWWKEQPSIFTVYLMKHIFQTSVLIMECIELNCLCKHMKKIRSSQPAIPVLKWLKHEPFPVVSIVNFESQFRSIFWSTSEMELFPQVVSVCIGELRISNIQDGAFYKSSEQLFVFDYLWKKLRQRCLTRFTMHLCRR